MELEIGDFVSAKFTILNKLETLKDHKEDCSKDEIITIKRIWHDVEYKDDYVLWQIDNCKVEQYFKLTPKEWDDITNNLFENRLIFRGKGGYVYTGTNPNINDGNFQPDEEMLKDYDKNQARLITILENDDTGELVAIDPEFHSYAYRLGIEVKKRV